MPTTADYLTQLQSDRDALADNLVAMGVAASQTETITSLVPKVLDIPSGASADGSSARPFVVSATININTELTI